MSIPSLDNLFRLAATSSNVSFANCRFDNEHRTTSVGHWHVPLCIRANASDLDREGSLVPYLAFYRHGSASFSFNRWHETFTQRLHRKQLTRSSGNLTMGPGVMMHEDLVVLLLTVAAREGTGPESPGYFNLYVHSGWIQEHHRFWLDLRRKFVNDWMEAGMIVSMVPSITAVFDEAPSVPTFSSITEQVSWLENLGEELFGPGNEQVEPPRVEENPFRPLGVDETPMPDVELSEEAALPVEFVREDEEVSTPPRLEHVGFPVSPVIASNRPERTEEESVQNFELFCSGQVFPIEVSDRQRDFLRSVFGGQELEEAILYYLHCLQLYCQQVRGGSLFDMQRGRSVIMNDRLSMLNQSEQMRVLELAVEHGATIFNRDTNDNIAHDLVEAQRLEDLASNTDN